MYSVWCWQILRQRSRAVDEFHTYSEVISIDTANGRVRAVRYRNTRSGEEHGIACEMVINAAGGWAQSVAALAGVEVPIRCDKGTLLVLNHRLSQRVINRCRKAGDADILVPAGPVCILGTSSIRVPSPEQLTASPEEIDGLLRLGNELVPGLADARVLRIFCGVRPLYVPKSERPLGGREISRGFALLDHETQDGVAGFVSIVGGKLTTYRLMAAAVCDCVSKKLGVDAECTTDKVPLRPGIDRKTRLRRLHLLPQPVAEKMVLRLGPETVRVVEAIEARPELAELVCECETGNARRIGIRPSADSTPFRGPDHCGRWPPHASWLWSLPGHLLRIQGNAGGLPDAPLAGVASRNGILRISAGALERAGLDPTGQAGRAARTQQATLWPGPLLRRLAGEREGGRARWIVTASTWF